MRTLREAERPIVNERQAVELRKTMVEGEQFIVSKTRFGIANGDHCAMCGKFIKRRDQRCR